MRYTCNMCNAMPEIPTAESKVIRIDGELYERLNQYCERTGRSRRWVADQAINKLMDSLDAYAVEPEDIQLAADDDNPYGKAAGE